MKKFLLGAALLSISMSCPAVTKQALILHMESGANIVYFLDEEPMIGFNGQTMVVTIDNEVSDIPMRDVNRWEIGMAEYAGVESMPESADVRISVDGNTLTVSNPDATGTVVYNMSGQIVGSGNQCVESFTLPRGIYVITVANNTYKIAIR